MISPCLLLYILFRTYNTAIRANGIVMLAKLRRSGEKHTPNRDLEFFGELHPVSSCFFIAIGVIL